MSSPVSLPRGASTLFFPLTRFCFGLCALSLLVWSAGCSGGSGPKTLVTGKVTYNGKPVAGTVTFVGGDGNEVLGPIMDGSYRVENPPIGPVKIGVKGMGGSVAPPVAPKDVKMPETGAGGTLGAGGVAPPAKYADPNKSGLTYEVKAGKQTHDIELK